ncbi:RHS repeat-associated core domain-containing protein, partial [Escherichia coli]|uniref:RHS repeat-associated core domain-containing protein n=1 Tax=Escherichia coli TaxID=562 RepID=UPI001C408C92
KDHGRVEQNLRYQGQYLDRETGLHYNLHRYYDPDVGRFMVTDPIGLAGGLNLYQYAPNPLKYIDPLGLKKELCNGTTRVRHYTNRKGSTEIGKTGKILAKDNNRVYLEPASKKPLSQVEVETKYQIKPGRGRDYVETDVPNEQLEWIPNPRYHTDELTAKGDITLSDNAKITKRK